MRMIYVPSHAENEPDVEAALEASALEVKRAKRPPESWVLRNSRKMPDEGESSDGYTEELHAMLEREKPALVLSLCYYPELSKLCQRAGVSYAAWVCVPYNPGLYSCTLLNECNYVFFSDYAMYEEFAGGDIRAFYLPLAADTERIRRLLAQKQDIPGADLSMMQDIIPRSRMPYHPLSLQSPLKDAAKGYLEGCIACRHQLSGLPSMAENLPPWVWEELAAGFPPDIREDSVETAVHYYDYRYFDALVTYADRDVHLGELAANPHFHAVCQYDSLPGYTGENVRCVEGFERLKSAPAVALSSKINLVIAHRSLHSGIPQIAWDIMASGGFLLGNYQADYYRLFPERSPILYGEERDMLSKAIYWLHHDREREELAAALAEFVRENHTYQKRVAGLLETVS